MSKSTADNKCKHLNKCIKVLETIVTCEITVIVCCDCKKEFSKPKTDC